MAARDLRRCVVAAFHFDLCRVFPPELRCLTTIRIPLIEEITRHVTQERFVNNILV